jgi:hypothetical protein
VLKTIQTKVLLSPYASLFSTIQERACNMIKTQILNFPFAVDEALLDRAESPSSSFIQKHHALGLGTGIAMSPHVTAPQQKSERLKARHRDIKT